MKRITRRQARSWLSPMRACFRQMLEGEVDAIHQFNARPLGKILSTDTNGEAE